MLPLRLFIMSGKWYAVRNGRSTGLFKSWDECSAQVNGYSGAQYKSFKTKEEAEVYLGGASGSKPATTTTAGRTSTAQGGASSRRTSDERGSNNQRFQPYSRQEGSNRSGVRSPPDQYFTRESPSFSANAYKKPTSVSKPDGSMVLSKVTSMGQSVPSPAGHRISQQPSQYQMNFDGASRGNPGKAGCGAVIKHVQTGEEVARLACPLPYGCTNNEAEYSGLILGLEACKALGVVAPVVAGDSKLVVNQTMGAWKVSEEASHLKLYRDTAQGLMADLSGGAGCNAMINHVRREHNSVADHLSNQAVDMQ